MRFQPIIALALLICGMLASPAAAQNTEGLYGRWEAYSTSAGRGILWLETGYLTWVYDRDQFTVYRFDVIQEFEGRMVVRMWNLRKDPVWPTDDVFLSTEDQLVIFDVADPYRSFGQTEPDLRIYSCSSPLPEKHVFQDTDPDAIWARILEWSRRSGEGFPYNRCNISADGSFDDGWGFGVYVR